MSVIGYKFASCNNCYKCLRECPVKAISMLNQDARIIDDYCILCGKCTTVCQQDAKFVLETLDEVKRLVKTQRVIASIAPSFLGSFDVKNISILKKALLKLGFIDAIETSYAASYVNEAYLKILDIKNYPVFITSSCPSINLLIEKYYPKALKYLAPVDSPMVAHGKIIKNDNPDCKVVFIGPCIAKKDEALKTEYIDSTLTFQELKKWLEEEKIDLSEIPSDNEEIYFNSARFYPIERGVVKSIAKSDIDYDYLSISGVEKCKEILENIDDLTNVFIEMNACEYGCINGPCVNRGHGSLLKITEMIRKSAKEGVVDPSYFKQRELDYSSSFSPFPLNIKIPDKAEMKAILASFGKYTKEDEINCGACGYKTCQDKAIAIYNKRAEKEMCFYYMKQRAESISSQVIKYSPNGIITFDKDYNILECNDKARVLLGIDYCNPVNRNIEEFIEMRPISETIISSETTNHRVHINKTNKDVVISSIYVKNHDIYFFMLVDVTDDEINRKKILKIKKDTLELTDAVIEKQMRTAQEIASLLGETTAETKIAIYNLRKVLLDESKEE